MLSLSLDFRVVHTICFMLSETSFELWTTLCDSAAPDFSSCIQSSCSLLTGRGMVPEIILALDLRGNRVKIEVCTADVG
jgi:hypothetical protein